MHAKRTGFYFLLTLAFDDNYDIAVLISGDADHAPAVKYIQKKTDKQVIQAFFKSHGDELRNACWDHIFFDAILGKFTLAPVPMPDQVFTGTPKAAIPIAGTKASS